ncbi:DEAD/DEAH box helicase [Ileibacterium valens]|uniref:DEAD/DEAH box helicase n=1 Tax=Ileibacterium valens TaxID=1862668 RepID=UPI00272B5653|nr:DEAD/DEAH box helicase [Ileibacterium valens]
METKNSVPAAKTNLKEHHQSPPEKEEDLLSQKLTAFFSPEGFKLDLNNNDLTIEDQEKFEEILQEPYDYLYEKSFLNESFTDPVLRFLKKLVDRYIEKLLQKPELEETRENTEVSFDEDELNAMIQDVPFVLNAEMVDSDWLKAFFEKIHDSFKKDAAAETGSMKSYFVKKNPELHTPDKLCFQLVENRNDLKYPFAFMVTYTRKMQSGKVRHVPLSQCLIDFKEQPDKLLSLLSGLNKASEICPMIEEFTVSGELMHPIRLNAKEASVFLSSADDLMKAGMVCRVPNWWKKKYSSVSLSVSMGSKKQSLFGVETLVSLKPSLMVNGKPLTKAEIKKLLEADEGLMLIKDGWVEVNHEKLKELLAAMDEVSDEMTLADLLRKEAGLQEEKVKSSKAEIGNGAWLAGLFAKMKSPKQAAASAIPKSVHAKLRPYQKSGVNWLNMLGSYGFGALLADDMGLGKTLQVLTYLEGLRRKNPEAKILLVVPASLLGNWQAEARKFVPEMPLSILHGMSAEKLEKKIQEESSFLNITTYGIASRMESLKNQTWDLLILDEAQAIKNPKTKQTRMIKLIPAHQKIALTGTPVENDLSNLWSIFDFLNSGLLGNQSQFSQYAKKLQEKPEGYGKLRNMIAPFILRRLKTDQSIVPDLPSKIEQTDYIELSAKQKAMYRKRVEELEAALEEEDVDDKGIKKKGLVLAALTALKQICNHPDQYSGAEVFKPQDSGKYEFLKEILEPIAEKRECVLVFSQYASMTEELDDYLAEIFGRKGLVINGSTPVKTRTEYATRFNEQKTYIPYMVLSLKAAGTGLNLVAANHVIHFDRWWNPAVENQATDRAFRIGQKKNVLVHKFVCKGTIEEKIDQLIFEKQQLADTLINTSEDGAEKMLSNMSNDELIQLMRLDV